MTQAAIVMLVTDDRGGEPKVLAVTNRRHGGWGLPGGKLEDVDLHDPKNAAVRELMEETGLRVNPEDLVRLGVASWDGTEVFVYWARATGGHPRRMEDGTEPRWRNFNAMVQDSPFAAYYRAMFPDGVGHLRATEMR